MGHVSTQLSTGIWRIFVSDQRIAAMQHSHDEAEYQGENRRDENWRVITTVCPVDIAADA
jgi:hypothetical protein